MNKENYIVKNGRWKRATKWELFKHRLKYQLKRWKIVDKYSYKIIPIEDLKRYFILTKEEYKDAQIIYKEKGTISYEFYPTGIGWGVKIHVEKTGEVIDITDVSTW